MPDINNVMIQKSIASGKCSMALAVCIVSTLLYYSFILHVKSFALLIPLYHFSQYSNNMRSDKSSTFVEAILLPYILLLAGKSGISHPCNVSKDKRTELSKYCFSGNKEEQVSIKRQKLIKESVNTSKDEFHTSIYELNACSNSFRESKENKKCVALSSHDMSCLVTFRSLEKENVVCPALLRSTSPIKDTSFNSKPTARKILLEFSSDMFLKYQVIYLLSLACLPRCFPL